MKTKRTQRFKPAPRQKLTYWYIAGGIALALLGGVGLFLYLNLGQNTDSEAATPDFYSVTNGFWTDGPTWAGGVAPATTGINSDIEIFEFVTRAGDLDYASGGTKTLIITDTLVVVGNLTMGNKSNVTVNDGGVLIITGNFSAENKIVVGNGGVIAVGGNLDFPTNGQDAYNGSSGDLFVSGTITGNSDASSAAQDASNFQSANPDVYEILIGATGTLPVTLLYFKATTLEGKVELSWETVEEINNDFFTIARSVDGKSFEKVATVSGAGTSQQHKTYSFIDTHPLDGLSYYRLSQMDFDGSSEQFKVVLVSRQAQSKGLVSPVIHTVAPNPFEASFQLEYEVPTAGPVRLQLMNLQGVIVASETLEATSGFNQYQFEQEQSLKSGIYLLTLSAGQHPSKAVRIVKR